MRVEGEKYRNGCIEVIVGELCVGHAITAPRLQPRVEAVCGPNFENAPQGLRHAERENIFF